MEAPKFDLVRDDHECAVAIAIDGRWVVQLVSGTERNAANSEKLLTVLNAAVAVVNNPAWAGVCDENVALEAALRDIYRSR